MDSFKQAREKVARTIRILYRIGYVLDYEGNVSTRTRTANRYSITPSQVPRYKIKASDILIVNEVGEVVQGKRNPSVETRMHLLIYSKRPDAGAVIHFHSLHATALASLHETIPPFLEGMIPYLGENVPTIEYAMAGTEELASNVANSLTQRNAVLLANHGAVVCGKDLQDAFHKALLLEKASTIYLLAKAVGSPRNLPEWVIEAERELFRTMML
ncbi:MAG: class II aldolase/adducin family protein [Candidatus Brockarchaeota archaeon]|nr:class II aldolase/adducin family protein [Candidatus Brockarchaeota archaeon]